MSEKYNPILYLWGLGITQPATIRQVQHVLELAFPNAPKLPNYDAISDQFKRWIDYKLITYSTSEDDSFYSLTISGNQALPKPLRFNKDRTRLFALKNARLSNSRASEKNHKEPVGVSPPGSNRLMIQERRPEQAVLPSGSAALFWPSPYKQFSSTTGRIPSFKEARLSLLSFDSITDLNSAAHRDVSSKFDLGVVEIALCIGISPNLLFSIIKKKENHYRRFTIEKKSGGERTIEAPRVFLKTIQRWISDYILCDLPVHHCCHSYRGRHSIITNADIHKLNNHVGNIDIKNFFGNTTNIKLVDELMTQMSDHCVFAIEELCTLNHALPQGAPTSPQLSNFILHRFDHDMEIYATDNGINYSRYADDITISGENKDSITNAFCHASDLLARQGYQINNKKTRIASKSQQQRVTGVVVNEKLQPLRTKRKQIRAAFHQAQCSPAEWVDRISSLQGFISYLQSFQSIKNSSTVANYKKILKLVISSQRK